MSNRQPGREATTVAEARAVATEIARAIMSEEVAQGRLCLSCWIVVKNDMGHNVMTVHFGDAVDVVNHSTCAHQVAASRDGTNGYRDHQPGRIDSEGLRD